MNNKVLVIGGAGQAGRIHVKNLLSLGVTVACFDLAANEDCHENFSPERDTYTNALAKGYTRVIIALPDNLLHKHANLLMEAHGEENEIVAILIEKPGSLNSNQLNELVSKAKLLQIPFFIDYQRSFDPRLAALAQKVRSFVEDDYDLEYVSVYSCDKAQPPQAAPQAINQGCHDYAMLLHILEAAKVKVQEVSARGVRWSGVKDTRFLKITGTAEKDIDGVKDDESIETLFDVQMGRVSSLGTFTEIYVKMSKFKKELNMYEPFETTLKFPEVYEPDSSWADTWSTAFVESVKNFVEFKAPSPSHVENGNGNGHANKTNTAPLVEAAFGVRVLGFAEKALASLKK